MKTLPSPPVRRGGRAVECGGLENRFTRKGNGGSNPSLSAKSGRVAAFESELGKAELARSLSKLTLEQQREAMLRI